MQWRGIGALVGLHTEYGNGLLYFYCPNYVPYSKGIKFRSTFVYDCDANHCQTNHIDTKDASYQTNWICRKSKTAAHKIPTKSMVKDMFLLFNSWVK